MEKSVIYRDRQELQADDLNRSQEWADAADCHIVTDAITGERQFVGLTVSARSATEIDVAPGRLYDGPTGKVYAIETAQTHSLFAMLPLQDKKWVAVSVVGQEENTDVQPRDFLIDLQSRQVEPQAVAMQRRRVAVVHIAQGLESPTPERPEPPTGYTLIAHVRLGPTGIQEVALATNRRLPQLNQVDARLKTVEGWILSTEPRIASIMTDIAGVADEVGKRATVDQVVRLALDVARAKQRLEIPDNYTWYGNDNFLSETESDTSASGYSARCAEGIRPPIAASETTALQIQNPLDPMAKVSSTQLLLPNYVEIPRLRMETRQGEITINQYQYQTTQLVQRTVARYRWRYGYYYWPCASSYYWYDWVYDPYYGIWRRWDEVYSLPYWHRQRLYQYLGIYREPYWWYDTYYETYWDTVTQTHTVQGSTIAQTILMAQTGWVTSIELYFTSVSSSAGLTLIVTDAESGQPNMNKVISRTTFAANALSGGWCKLTLSEPLLVEAGKRYAIVLVTTAPHRIGYTTGTEYTQGLLLYSQDGQYFTEAADRDLMMRLNFARFVDPRVVVQLQPLQLAGGIADIDINADCVIPSGCELIWEYQVGGVWRQITKGVEPGLGTTPIVPIRAVFVGTQDLMPAIRLGNNGSQVVASRQGNSFTHISTARTLSQASQDIRVRLLLEGFNSEAPANHTITCQLLSGSNAIEAQSYRDEIVDQRTRWREFRFAPSSGITSYRIKIAGTNVTATHPWNVAERYDIAL